MNYNIESKLRHFPRPYITDAELESLLRGASPNSRHAKLKRLRRNLNYSIYARIILSNRYIRLSL